MPHGSRLSAVAIVIAPLLSGCQAGTAQRPPEPAPVVAPQALSLIPEPAKLERREGRFTLTHATVLVCPPADAGCGWVADYFARVLSRTRGLALDRAASEPVRGAIVFRRTAGPADSESYTLDVAPERIVIAASSDAGLFYGVVTLWQLATQSQGPAPQIDIPALAIADSPRFAWRGVLLDSARHFQSPAFVEALIDAMALHKLNVLQWHLTDDQGWRLQIKKYPLLTQIGAWRPDGKGGRYGGFYTQQQVRDIVAFARQRNVTIVPEIEMPGHALAAIVAYPRLGSVRHPPKNVSSDWGVFPYLFNVDRSTFAFLDNVLKETMALFPSRTIHIGGDEAVKDEWNASPRIRRQMHRLHLKDANALQAWFTARIGGFLAAHHRRLIGWDEILNSKLAPDAAVTSWRTIESAGTAASQDHDVVLSPSPTLYFDYCQVLGEGEPPCRGIEVSLRQVYDFDPANAPHLIGVQGSLWTERLDTDERVAYAAFPRAAALAELGWTPRAGRSWDSFVARMPAMLSRYRALKLAHSESAFAVAANAEPSVDGARLRLSTQAGLGAIHFTLDGSAPGEGSPAYDGPFEAALPVKLAAQAFEQGEALAKPLSISFDARSVLRRSSYDMAQCTNDLPLALEAGDATVMVNVMNPCWIYKGLDLTGIGAIEFGIVRFPFNYQIGADIKKIPLTPDAAPQGQLEIRLDGCQGERLAVLPLSSTVLRAALPPRQGVHDLCLVFARRSADPVWAIDWAQPIKE